MKTDNMKKIVFALAAVFLALLLVCGCMMLSGKSDKYCYTKVDGSCMEEQSGERKGVIDFTGGMKYLYTQPAYDINGNSETVTFGANRILKEGAYLKLTLSPIRGVTDWEEVRSEDLPDKVKDKFNDR